MFAISGDPVQIPEVPPVCIQNQHVCHERFALICDNNTWVPFDECDYGCFSGECLEKDFWDMVYTIIIAAVLVTVAAVGIYFVWKKRHKLLAPKAVDSEELLHKVGRF